MPLVEYYKQARIYKRSAKLKGRPEYQDLEPDSPEGWTAYRIAAKYEDRFSRAFLDAMRGLLDEKMPKEFKKGWESKSVSQMMQAIPLFNEGSTDQLKVWRSFQDRMAGAYGEVVDAAGKEATSQLNKKFKTNLGFTIKDKEPGEEVEVLKAKRKKVPVVPVNPYSVAWIEAHGLELVTQGITPQQVAVVTGVIGTGFELGERAEEVYGNIRANIGLTNRESTAVFNRKLLLEQEGFSVPEVKRLTDKYRETKLLQRAKRIARTETIRAQAQGRSDAWKLAQEQGQLPLVKRIWIAPPASPNPNRPCEICLDLDGKEAKVGEPYESIEGPIEMPPAHPSCRCSESLVRA
jgi:hypothetical protein